MDLPADSLQHRGSVEHLSLDADLRIISFSEGAPRFADDPSFVVPGEDVRLGFPEFVGAEKDLFEILEGHRFTWSLLAICRSRGEEKPTYIDVSAESFTGAGDATPSLVITLEEVTSWMEQIQAKTQSANDASLLLHSLTASKKYIESILDAMADLLVVTSPDGTITSVNRTALRISGHATPDLLGKPITLLIPDISLAPPPTASSPFAGIELRCSTRSGVAIPMSFTRALLEGSGENPGGVVYVGRDLRERHQAAEYISKLEIEKRSLQDVLNGPEDSGKIVGSSRIMTRLMKDLAKVAPTDTTVLITGETGTGKEVVARAIHRASQRSKKMLVTVNCASLPDGLVESELFGHEKGAFTGATQRHIGRFELADGGTVFLDEIGELPLSAQAKLLRVLQEQTFERVGGTQTVNVDVRVITATNRDLTLEVRNGRFREDLLFRLNVFPITVAALRDRPEDIMPLAEHFLRLFSRRTNKHVESISPQATQKLQNYHWPGNIRELANAIERAMIVCEGSTLEARDLALAETVRDKPNKASSFDEVARQHILDVLRECNGTIEGTNGAAAKLGINPATLRSRMKKLGIGRIRGGFEATPSTS